MPLFKKQRSRDAKGVPSWRRQIGNVSVERRSYAATELRVHGHACKAARALSGKRFLVAEAPKLPLETCNVRCRCTYQHHSDRRQEPRRSFDVGVTSEYSGKERRSGLDRRGHRADEASDYYSFMEDK